MPRLRFVFVALALCLLGSAPAMAQAAPGGCQYVLGFRTLHDLDPADIGDCVDNQAFAANGDAQQHTTKGLLAWRKADNWTAFTNGYWTWINGPNGLAKRLNSQRFAWEANPDGLPLVGGAAAPPAPAPAAPAPSAPSAPAVAFADQGIAILAGGKFRDADGDALGLAFVRNTTAQPLSAIVDLLIGDANSKLLGKATAAVNDLQPGQTRLVAFDSQVPYDQASGASWQVDLAMAGSTLPTVFALGTPTADQSAPGFLLVPVKNSSNATHSAIISVAITDANGGILDLASGAVNDLGPGQTRMVEVGGLLNQLPAGAHLTPQVDTAL